MQQADGAGQDRSAAGGGGGLRRGRELTGRALGPRLQQAPHQGVRGRLRGLSAGAPRLAPGTCAHMRACEQLMGGHLNLSLVVKLCRVRQHLHGPPQCMAGSILTKAMQTGQC